MKISWLGHACFLIETSQGTKIITDPYDKTVGYDPIGIDPDIVTVSHQHFDHNYTQEFRKAKIFDKEGEFEEKGVRLKALLSFHDKEKGALRGKNLIFVINADDIKVAHFGDLGTLDLDYDKLKDIDIALIPVGGTFTIDAKEASQLIERIQPKIAIPMHYKTSKLGFSIDGVERFLEGKENVERKEFLEIKKEELKYPTKIIVLKHLR